MRIFNAGALIVLSALTAFAAQGPSLGEVARQRSARQAQRTVTNDEVPIRAQSLPAATAEAKLGGSPPGSATEASSPAGKEASEAEGAKTPMPAAALSPEDEQQAQQHRQRIADVQKAIALAQQNMEASVTGRSDFEKMLQIMHRNLQEAQQQLAEVESRAGKTSPSGGAQPKAEMPGTEKSE